MLRGLVDTVPHDDARRVEVQAPRPDRERTSVLRAMSWNIRYGDYDSRELTNIGNYCRGSDVVCLQEVDLNTNRPRWLPQGSGDQLAKLRPYLGHGAYFRGARYPGALGLGRGWMGNAILSRWPIVRAQAYPGGNADWPLSYARIEHPTDGPLHVFSEHYPLRPPTLQMRHSKALVAAIKTVTREGGRVIVGGDFNHGFEPDHLGWDPVGYVARLGGLQWAFVPGRDTWPQARHPQNKWPADGPHHIDHILTRGFRSASFECVLSAGSYSDHPAIRSELEAVPVPPVPVPDPPVPGPIPPNCQPIADAIDALNASIRRLQGELGQAPPGDKPGILESIREMQEKLATRQADLEQCKRAH